MRSETLADLRSVVTEELQDVLLSFNLLFAVLLVSLAGAELIAGILVVGGRVNMADPGAVESDMPPLLEGTVTNAPFFRFGVGVGTSVGLRVGGVGVFLRVVVGVEGTFSPTVALRFPRSPEVVSYSIWEHLAIVQPLIVQPILDIIVVVWKCLYFFRFVGIVRIGDLKGLFLVQPFILDKSMSENIRVRWR